MNALRWLSLALTVVLAGTTAPAARSEEQHRLETNQAYVEEATRAAAFAIDDPMAVFAFVLGSLPDRVKVYPTENYYYFTFVHGGVPYAGNLRLGVADRDAGKVDFGYFRAASAWYDDAAETFLVLDATRGVQVEKLEPLFYRVTYGTKSVVFALNDLSQVSPPAHATAPDERFMGPIFDESGVRFFLMYNARLKVFHYILDETAGVPDHLAPMPGNDRILIGARTGFAFYRDHRRDRKILIGAFSGNVAVNNYFDGPFDQMPENFITGEEFREALIAMDPDLKGKVDRLGVMADGARYAITPYMHYRRASDLAVFHRCATSRRIPRDAYYACFVLLVEGDDAKGQPLAMERKSR